MAKSTDIVTGQELMVFYGGKSIAFSTSSSLSISGQTTDISTKDHGFFGATKLTGITWEITSDNLYTDAAYSNLFKAMTQTREMVEIVWGHYTEDTEMALTGIVDQKPEKESWTSPGGTESNTTGKAYYKGNAYITSLNITASNGDNATMSITFSGVGALTEVPGAQA